jgi:UDPglucose 6-dehydrogenase
LSSQRLTFSTNLADLYGRDLVFICVGTLDSAGEWSGQAVQAAVYRLADDPSMPRTVVIRSTLSPGTMVRLHQERPNVELIYLPEFTRQGQAMQDFATPDRLVVGAFEPLWNGVLDVLDAVGNLDSTGKVFVTDPTSAELVKMGSNVALALKVGFANEMARLTEAVGGRTDEVLRAIGADSRIGPAFLTPGPGFGGSCLPSQARELPFLAGRLKVPVPILDSIDDSNDGQASWVCRQVWDVMKSTDVNVTVLGLTFKAGTDDLRESPALKVCNMLLAGGARLTVHDPAALDRGAKLLPGAIAVADPVAAVGDAHAIVVLTEWDIYRTMKLPRGVPVIDPRGVRA